MLKELSMGPARTYGHQESQSGKLKFLHFCARSGSGLQPCPEAEGSNLILFDIILLPPT